MDNSEPIESSAAYSTPLQIAASTTVKAKAFYSTWTPSATAIANYNITGKVATPSINPPEGTYSSAQTVTITCATTGASVYYALDGSEPNTGSTLYANAIQVTSTTTIKAKAFKNDWLPSEIATATYAITGTVAMPTFNPPAGTYATTQSVTISCLTPGATIRFTLDNSDPSESSAVYSAPLQMAASTTVKAKAFYSTWTPSATAIANYNITGTVATPSINPTEGTYASAQTVTITCATTGASVYYTLDGSEPNTGSTLYTNAIQVTSTTTIKAKAFKNDWLPSEIATATYTITSTVAMPTFDKQSGLYYAPIEVSISCLTPGAIIRYTLDNSEPIRIECGLFHTAANVSFNHRQGESLLFQLDAQRDGYCQLYHHRHGGDASLPAA